MRMEEAFELWKKQQQSISVAFGNLVPHQMSSLLLIINYNSASYVQPDYIRYIKAVQANIMQSKNRNENCIVHVQKIIRKLLQKKKKLHVIYYPYCKMQKIKSDGDITSYNPISCCSIFYQTNCILSFDGGNGKWR